MPVSRSSLSTDGAAFRLVQITAIASGLWPATSRVIASICPTGTSANEKLSRRPERLVRERDLGDLEAGEMRRHLGQAGQHGGGDRLQRGVRRRRQHAEKDGFGHPALHSF